MLYITSKTALLLLGRVALAYVDAACCYRRSTVVCRSVTIVSRATNAEPVEMQFGVWTRVGPRKHGVGIGATWRIRLNRPFAAAMWPLCHITLSTLTRCFMVKDS